MSWRRILLLSLVFVLALGGVTWAVLRQSDAATAMLRRELGRILATPLNIESTEIDLGAGRLVVRGLQLEDPERPGVALVSAARIDLDADFDLGALVALRQVTIAGLAVDIGKQPPTLAQLVRPGGATAGAGRIPAISVTDGHIRLACTPGSAPVIIEQLALAATPVAGEPLTLAISGEARIAGLEALLSVSGHVDTQSGSTDLIATVQDLPLNGASLRWLEDRLGVDPGDLEVEGVLKTLEIGLRAGVDGQAKQFMRVEARGAITGARLAGTSLPRQLRSADVTFVASSDNNGEITARLIQSGDQGDIDLASEITNLIGDPRVTVRAKGTNLVIDEDMNAALRLFPVGDLLVDALQPQGGRGDIEIYLRDPQLADGIAEFDLTLRDGALSYHGYGDAADRIGFPLPLVDARGAVHLRNNIVELDQLTAKIAPEAGGGTVTLSGQIDTLAEAVECTTIDLVATGIEFTAELRGALATLLDDDGALYDRLAPEGRADVDVSIRPVSILAGGFSVAVRPQSATVTWAGFPYRLDGIRGNIVVRQAAADFDLEGQHDHGTVTLHGRIPLLEPAEETGGFEVAVQLNDLQIDDQLRRAVAVMAPAIDDAWRGSTPNGRCSGTVRAWRPRMADDLQFDLRIDLDTVDLRLPVDPWRAEGLSGRLLIAGSGDAARIDFDALRGSLTHGTGQAAALAMLGQVQYGPTPGSDLSLVVRGLELDAELGRTLELLRALGPGVWDYLAPAGAVDLVCRHRLQPDSAADLDLVVHLLDVESNAPILPQPARHMTGELHIREGRLTFEELRADLGGNLVRCLDGAISTAPPPDGRTEIAFTVTAADFPLGRELANLFPGPLRQTIAERSLSGTADIDRLRLGFAVPTTGSTMPFETTLSGELRLQDVGLTLGTGSEGFRVDQIYGTVTLDESRVGDAGGELVGNLDNSTLRMFGQPFASVSGRFSAGPERTTLQSLQGRFHGGVIKQQSGDLPALVYRMPGAEVPDGRLMANLAFEGVDVHSFLLTAGWDSPPYRGTARGHIVLERLDGHDVVDAVGTGALAIQRGDLGVVPLFTAIYSQLPAPERPRFDQLDLALRLDSRRVALDNLVLRSNLLAATGSGSLDLDGYLDIKLTLDNLLGNTADPLFTPLIDFLTQSIVRFHLFGHLRDLKAEKRWITESSPPRAPVAPLPPVAERRPIADY